MTPPPARFLGLWGSSPSLNLRVFVSHGSGLMEAECTVEGIRFLVLDPLSGLAHFKGELVSRCSFLFVYCYLLLSLTPLCLFKCVYRGKGREANCCDWVSRQRPSRLSLHPSSSMPRNKIRLFIEKSGRYPAQQLKIGLYKTQYNNFKLLDWESPRAPQMTLLSCVRFCHSRC